MRDTSADRHRRGHSDDCVIYATPAKRGHFKWGWRSTDRRRQSRTLFAYFYDCLADARLNGYEVDPARVAAQLRGTELTIQIVPKIKVREPHT